MCTAQTCVQHRHVYSTEGNAWGMHRWSSRMHHFAFTMKQQMIEHCMLNEVMAEGHNKKAS